MIKLIITKCKTGKVYEIPAHEGIQVTFSKKSASCMTLKRIKLINKIEVGDIVSLFYGDRLLWKGVTFDDNDSIKAHCLLRYLNTPEVMKYKDITLSQYLQEASQCCILNYVQTAKTYYKYKTVELDNVTHLTKVCELIEEEFIQTGVEYILQGHLGFVTLINQNKCIYKRELPISDIKIARSIDSNTHNQIIVFDKSKTDFAVAQSMESIRHYGLLRTILVADSAQDLQYYANLYLGVRNTIKVSVNFTVHGGAELLEITQGYLVPVITEEFNQYFIVDSVTHKITNHGVESTIKARNYTEEMV